MNMIMESFVTDEQINALKAIGSKLKRIKKAKKILFDMQFSVTINDKVDGLLVIDKTFTFN